MPQAPKSDASSRPADAGFDRETGNDGRLGDVAGQRRPELSEVRIRYLAGQSADMIASSLKMSRAAVFRALRATATPGRRVGRPAHPLEMTLVVRRYRAGASVSALARDFQCHRATILRALRKAGVPTAGAPSQSTLPGPAVSPSVIVDPPSRRP